MLKSVSVRRKEGKKKLIRKFVVYKVSESSKLKVTATQNKLIKTKRIKAKNYSSESSKKIYAKNLW